MEDAWADVKIVSSDGYVFPVHRFMLSSYSEVLREEFIQLDRNKATTGDTESSSKSSDKQNKQEKSHAGKIPVLKIDFESAATAIMINYMYSDKTTALCNIKEKGKEALASYLTETMLSYAMITSLVLTTYYKKLPSLTEKGYRDLATCVQVCILAHKFVMLKLHELIWPQVLDLAEKQLLTSPATVLSAIEKIYIGIPKRKSIALPLVEMIAKDFEKLRKIPEIKRFAKSNAKFGWHLSVSLQIRWEKEKENWKKHEGDGKENAGT